MILPSYDFRILGLDDSKNNPQSSNNGKQEEPPPEDEEDLVVDHVEGEDADGVDVLRFARRPPLPVVAGRCKRTLRASSGEGRISSAI